MPGAVALHRVEVNADADADADVGVHTAFRGGPLR